MAIGEADLWLVHELNHDDNSVDGRLFPGLAADKDKAQIVAHLQHTLAQKVRTVDAHHHQLDDSVYHDSYGTIMLGELVLCAGLDHEAHHRGQIAVIRAQNRPAGER